MTTKYTKENLQEIFAGQDAVARKAAMEVLRVAGLKPQDYVRWTAEDKTAKILELQGGSAGGGAKTGVKAVAKTGNKAAAATTTAKTAATEDSGGVSSAAINELLELVRAQGETITALQASFEELAGFVQEGHWLGLQTAISVGADLNDAEQHGTLLLGNAEG